MGSDWDGYRYFLATARCGSQSAAARSMQVDQSTVGRRLAALETEVGARLFDHTPEGYVLTAAGENVLARVEEIEAGFLAVERRLAGGETRSEGVVRVSVSEPFANIFLIAHLARLRSRHPRLSIELLTGNEPVDLARREADLALRLGARPRQPNLVVRQLGAAGFALYASPGYLARRGRPNLRDGLRGHEIVAYCGELASVPMAGWMTQRGQKAEVALRANSVASVHRAVVADLGMGVLPCAFAGELQRVGPVLGKNPIWSVVHEDLVRSARVRAVQVFLQELVKEERAALAGL